MAKKIKVLVVTHTFPTKHNPIGAIFLLNQLEHLKKFCDIKIVFPHGYVPRFKFLNPYHRYSQIPYFETVKGMEVYHPKYLMIPRAIFKLKLLNLYISIESFFSYFSSLTVTEKIMKEWNPDVIHMHGGLSEAMLCNHLKKKYKKPLILTVYGEDVTRYLKEN